MFRLFPMSCTVTYRVSGDLEAFKVKATEVAARIAGAPGVRWKVWGLGPDGAGVSAYLFETAEAADAFASGPVIAGLQANPAVPRASPWPRRRNRADTS